MIRKSNDKEAMSRETRDPRECALPEAWKGPVLKTTPETAGEQEGEARGRENIPRLRFLCVPEQSRMAAGNGRFFTPCRKSVLK
jgi:hypothetical protein